MEARRACASCPQKSTVSSNAPNITETGALEPAILKYYNSNPELAVLTTAPATQEDISNNTSYRMLPSSNNRVFYDVSTGDKSAVARNL